MVLFLMILERVLCSVVVIFGVMMCLFWLLVLVNCVL